MHKTIALTAAVLFSLPLHAFAQQTWSQKSEVQPAVERGMETAVAGIAKPEIPDSAFSEGAVPSWIWGTDNDKNYVLRKSVELKAVKSARLRASCDNVGTVLINGKRVAGSREWQEPMDADVTKLLVEGANFIEADVENQGGVAAFVFKLVVKQQDGTLVEVVTDESWEVAAKRGEPALSEKVALRGKYGDGPWGAVFSNAAIAGRVPAGTFEVLPGFQVEKLFTVPKDELGSWVCLAFDNKGRLLASDQGDKGIYRITLPPVNLRSEISDLKSDQSGERKAESRNDAEQDDRPKTENRTPQTAVVETTVERLDFSKCEFQPTGAQGMLWAFDSLYFSINGGPGSGLYRARDKDGDDQFDECVRLKEFRGGGEHGPHALRLSPDGKRIFVICGNHTLPPFNAGEELTNKDYTSRVPTNWAEDHLLPRMWDANGHARGVMAPGGWIASTDPDGKSWDIFSMGYRNPYDMAFNADGELFAYDADMEWDVGMPWYRPTRVVHATSGSEFGWRSGSGKWPNHYIDSLPPMVNIGPGSPVGVDFGYGSPLAADSEIAKSAHATVPVGDDGKFVYAPLKFPAKYQKALYICDWTFGTMYAIHTEPHMSTYKASKEEFVSRTPLPLTDVVAGPDGALYFSVGGRGTQSELFRVIYVGTEESSPADLRDKSQAGPRSRRRTMEAAHDGVGANGPQSPLDTQTFLSGVRDDIRSGDRFLKSASRNAFYHSPLFAELMKPSVLASADFTQSSPDEILGIVTAFAKAPVAHLVASGKLAESDVATVNEGLRKASLRSLSSLSFTSLTHEQQLAYLRALSLVFLRLGPADEAAQQDFIGRLDHSFPSKDDDLNRELVQVLIYLKSPTVIEKTVKLLEAPSKPTVTDDLKDLLARNRGYGGAIAASVEKAPDQQQTWYAFCLRNTKEGWTMDQRKAYFAWFERAHTWAGGASFHGFLNNIEKEAFENASEKERLLIEASGARKPYALPEIPKPAGPGKDWTLDEVRALVDAGLKDRNFENGQKMFAATRCIICHRFGGDGGATGPDLTQLAGRFNVKDLTEAIMEPSKVISDQYKASTIVTTDGKSYSGRIVAENDDKITMLTSAEDPTKITEIAKADIEETQPSAVSIMPMDLLKPLNQEEVLDLMAYLLSRGDQGNPMFSRK
jgi:putative heme-binding domain-containing protein